MVFVMIPKVASMLDFTEKQQWKELYQSQCLEIIYQNYGTLM